MEVCFFFLTDQRMQYSLLRRVFTAAKAKCRSLRIFSTSFDTSPITDVKVDKEIKVINGPWHKNPSTQKNMISMFSNVVKNVMRFVFC